MQQPQRVIPPFIGTISLIVGACIIFLIMIDPTQSFGWQMPASWYTNRAAWFMGSAVCLAFGSGVLYNAGYAQRIEEDNRRRRQSVFESLTLYTRDGCHLCDDAVVVLEKFRDELPAAKIVDIDKHPELIEKFNTCVPVVEIDGRVRFRGKVNPTLLRRLIDGAGSDDSPS